MLTKSDVCEKSIVSGVQEQESDRACPYKLLRDGVGIGQIDAPLFGGAALALIEHRRTPLQLEGEVEQWGRRSSLLEICETKTFTL